MKNSDIISTRLKNLRESNKLTQKDMQDILGCSQSSYSGYESGKTPLNTDALITLSECFHVSIDWLLGTEQITSSQAIQSVKDIIEMLFKLDENVKTRIEETTIIESLIIDDYQEDFNVKLYGLTFYPATSSFDFNAFMKEWKEIKDFCNDKEIGSKMYELWKKDKLEKTSKKSIKKSVIPDFSFIPDDVTEELPFESEPPLK
ncbi:MAG: helix-turn-helix domain-containing protein [Blautia sp.]|jgi:transcriptional regulator with XRE-family HTH domain